jgi:Ni,Fe-hydrogenase III small subunit
MYSKILATKNRLIEPRPLPPDAAAALSVGPGIEAHVRTLFRGSLAIRVVTAGSTNACEQELTALGNPYYDVERFGVHFVASPRHADMLMVTGPVSRNMREALLRTYDAMPTPKIVVAVGDDAIDGGIFRGSYGVLDGAHAAVPVDYQIPGDPPSPETILASLLALLTDLDGKL